VLHALTIMVFLIASSALPARIVEERGIPVLAYHRFDPLKSGSTTVTTATFRSQLDWLVSHGYAVVPLTIVVAMVQRHALAPPNTIAITVDDGHVSVFTTLFPLILQYHIPVTLFVYPSAISNASYALTWEQLKEMKASGLVDIQAHTYWHPNFRKEKTKLLPADYEKFVMNQLVRSKAVLEMRLGSSVTMMAWPFGIYDHDLEQAAGRAGYTASFAYAGGAALPTSDLFAVPRIPVSNEAQGLAFAAMLDDAPSRSDGSVAKQQHTHRVAGPQ
jgi:peptidoglycan/xylan/chitin deacetylase (PgdA/CDA1 family)